MSLARRGLKTGHFRQVNKLKGPGAGISLKFSRSRSKFCTAGMQAIWDEGRTWDCRGY